MRCGSSSTKKPARPSSSVKSHVPAIEVPKRPISRWVASLRAAPEISASHSSRVETRSLECEGLPPLFKTALPASGPTDIEEADCTSSLDEERWQAPALQ